MDTYDIKKGATTAILFQMFASSDHNTGINGLTLTMVLKKPGIAFAARDAGGTVTSTGTGGWYEWIPTATDTNTFGFTAVEVSGTGADPKSFRLNVIAQDPYTLILDTATSALTTAGTVGKLWVDNLNATITSRMATFTYTAPPTAAAIGTAVWETLTSGITLVGSFGVLLKSMLDQAISSRMATFTYTAPPAINAIATGVRTELATELTKVSNIYAAVDTEIPDLLNNVATANAGIVTANAALVTLGTNLATTDGKVVNLASAVSDVNGAVSAVGDAVEAVGTSVSAVGDSVEAVGTAVDTVGDAVAAIPPTDLTAVSNTLVQIKTNTDKWGGTSTDQVNRVFAGLANRTSFDPETGVGIIYGSNGTTPLFTYQMVTDEDGVITSKTPA